MKHASSLFTLTLALLLLVCSHAHAQTRAVLKTPGSNALIEPLSTGAQSLTISAAGTLVLTSGCTISGGGTIPDANIASAATWNAKQSALTFGTGLTNTSGTVTVNTEQNITRLSNLTSIGVVTSTSTTGVLGTQAVSIGGVGTSDGGKIVQFAPNGVLQAVGSVVVYATSGSAVAALTPTALTWLRAAGGSYNLTLALPTLTATRTITWPNNSGTVALTSDIPSYTFSTGLTNTAGTLTVNTSQAISQLSNLTTNGAVTTTANNGTLGIVQMSTGGNATADAYKMPIFGSTGQLTASYALNVNATSGTGNADLTPTGAHWRNVGGSIYTIGFAFTTPTAARVFTFPNNGGTVALTSDLASFITGNQSITLSGDVTGTGATAISATLANSGVTAGTYGSATQSLTQTVDAKGRVTSLSAQTVTPAESSITFTDITTGNASSTNHGYLPKLSGTTTQVLNGAGSFVGLDTISGLASTGLVKRTGANTYAIATSGTDYGNVSGPGSSTDKAVPRWNGTGGSTLQNSAMTIDNSGNVLVNGTAGFTTPMLGIGQTNQGFASIGSGRIDCIVNGTQAWTASAGAWFSVELLGVTTTAVNFNQYNFTGPQMSGTTLGSDACLVVANSSTPQRFSVMNTYTDSTHFEGFEVDWKTAANVCILNTAKGSGGGTARNMSLRIGGSEKLVISPSGLAVGSTGTPHSKIKSGTAVLVAGTVTVSDSDVLETGTASTSSRILITRMKDGGTLGDSYSITRVNGTSFTITAKSANSNATGDTSTVSYVIFNP